MALTRVTSDVVDNNLQQSGFKNKIIGGDFSSNPWQRGVTFASVANSLYTADRWQYRKSTDTSVVSIIKSADAPSASQAEMFTQHCIDVDITTADTAIGIAEYSYIEQKIEGMNSMSLGFGRAGSRFVTLSFWHKNTKTGSYSVSLSNSALTRSYVASYNQVASNVWEKSVITIPVDTAGAWLYDNGIGLRVRFCIASGTTYQVAAGSWVAGDFLATSSQVNGLDSTSNNFKIALVQLEYGSKASDFDARSVGQELSICQRYYEIGTANYNAYPPITNQAVNAANTKFLVTKRSISTITPLIFTGIANAAVGATRAYTSTDSFMRYCLSSSGGAEVLAYETWTASAEL